MTRQSIPVILKEAADWMVKALRQGQIGIDDVMNATKKLHLRPRFLKDIGQGAEGVAKLHTDPVHGVAVHKAWDPFTRFYTDGRFEGRHQLAKKLTKGNNDLFAKYWGKDKGRLVTKHQFIGDPKKLDYTVAKRTNPRGRSGASDRQALKDLISLQEGHPKYRSDYHKAKEHMSSLGQGMINDVYPANGPFGPHSGNAGNVLRDMQGKPRIIDFIPDVNRYGRAPSGTTSRDIINDAVNTALEKRMAGRGYRFKSNTPIEAVAYNIDRRKGTFNADKVMKYVVPESPADTMEDLSRNVANRMRRGQTIDPEAFKRAVSRLRRS